jgi:ABC-2 type transport system permease protein
LNLGKVWAFAKYEVRRASARKKVLALVVLTLLLDTVPYYLLRTVGASFLPATINPYLWILGIFVPEGLFLPFIALLIAAGSMSEEYEQGTAEVLLSKPVSRNEYIAGKYLGGYLLLVMVVSLNGVLAVTTATFTFGPQLNLGVLPVIVLAQFVGGLVFYSIAFMAGELVRRSSLSYIVASAVFFISYVMGIFLSAIYEVTGNVFYHNVDIYLPTTPVSSLPLLVGVPSLKSATAVLTGTRIVDFVPVESSVGLSIALILVYALTTTMVAVLYFNRVDVAKKVY